MKKIFLILTVVMALGSCQNERPIKTATTTSSRIYDLLDVFDTFRYNPTNLYVGYFQ